MAGLSGFFTLIQSRDGSDRGGAQPFRDDTLKTRLVRLMEDQDTVLIGVLADDGANAREDALAAIAPGSLEWQKKHNHSVVWR
jgi:hypothetical protein